MGTIVLNPSYQVPGQPRWREEHICHLKSTTIKSEIIGNKSTLVHSLHQKLGAVENNQSGILWYNHSNDSTLQVKSSKLVLLRYEVRRTKQGRESMRSLPDASL